MYDFLFAVGVLEVGLEDPAYWAYLRKAASCQSEAGREFKIDALPHESEFLVRCGFFLIPARGSAATTSG